MATYTYVCKTCGAAVEYDRLLADNTRHVVAKKVCGTLRRDWKTDNVAVNTANLRKAR